MNPQRSNDRLQLTMAAVGCVSGTLVEWPQLLAALQRAGRPATKHTSADEARRMAQEALRPCLRTSGDEK